MIRNLLNFGRDRRPSLLHRQFGCNFGINENPSNDVDEVKRRQEKTRKHGCCIKLHNRLSCNCRIDNDHHGWRDQNAQGATRRDDTGGQTCVIAGIQHGPHRNDAHEHHDRANQTTCNAPEGTNDQGGNSQRSRQLAKSQLHAVEHFVNQCTSLHDIAHEHKQGN